MIQLGRIFGFPLALDFTALVVIGLIVLMGARSGAQSMLLAVITGVCIFGSVLVHELGHAWLARHYRLGPVDITLHGFGGLTRFRAPTVARQGLLITLAGPAAGLALGALSLALALALAFFAPGSVTEGVFFRLATINLIWSVFNLLPMYPLDGGSVLFYLLSFRTDRDSAMRWAARVGVLVALVVGLWGYSAGEWFIVLVAVMSLMRSFPLATAR